MKVYAPTHVSILHNTADVSVYEYQVIDVHDTIVDRGIAFILDEPTIRNILRPLNSAPGEVQLHDIEIDGPSETYTAETDTGDIYTLMATRV